MYIPTGGEGYLSEVRMGRVILHQLLHHEGDGGRGDPLPVGEGTVM